jgi:ribosome assembly protein 1
MDPIDAYLHLYNLLERVNSLMGSLIVRDINKESDNKKSPGEDEDAEDGVDLDTLIEERENEAYFNPTKGNVVFASALDCWAFTLSSFSEILHKKIGFKKEIIEKLLWGDYYYNHKSKKVYTQKIHENSKPMFVEFVLDNIYKLYNLVYNEKNVEKINKAAAAINVTVNKSELNFIEKDPKPLLKSIIRQWLPVAPTVFDVVLQVLPTPIKGYQTKRDVLFPSYKLGHSENTVIAKFDELAGQYLAGEEMGEDVPILSFVSKMVPIEKKNIGGDEFYYDKNRDDIKFMPFARNYIGTIKKGKEYYVIGPKHDPKSNYYDIQKFKFENLYFFMGQYLEPVDEVPPGNIFSVSGLENYIFKTATISSFFESPTILPSNINVTLF